MMEATIKEELIRRYKYLYSNKELILSLCISEGIEEKRLKSYLKTTKETLRSYRKFPNQSPHMLFLIQASIEEAKKSLDNPKFYLKDKINPSILDMIKNFLFTDYPFETTSLYQEIERIKEDEVELANAEYLINDINYRRAKNAFLQNRPIFTVWHILDYIRSLYPTNQDIQEYLDIYYNLERYMLTGIDWLSGYYLEHIDEQEYQSYIESHPYYISSGVKTSCDESYIIASYKGNEFETEDEYFTPVEDIPKPRVVNDYPSKFVYNAIRLYPISEEEKRNISLELQGKAKTLFKEQ